MNPSNYLTIDIEDYYQVSSFESLMPISELCFFPFGVTENTQNILSILDKNCVKIIFFILAWTTENYPSLVREIAATDHEICCHSYQHEPVYNQTPEEFRHHNNLEKTETRFSQLPQDFSF